MSTRDDATLSSEERAAFARIEAQAKADDPRLGVSPAIRIEQVVRRIGPVVARVWSHAWVGPVVVVLGIAGMIVGLATTVLLAMVGLVLVVVGAVPIVVVIQARLNAASERRAASADAQGSPPPAG